MFKALLLRELRLANRKKVELFNPLFFFLLVTSLFPFGTSPDSQLLSQIAPGVIWVCALLSVMLSLDVLYREDFDDGSLVQMMMTGASPNMVVVVKAITHWLFTALPLIVVSPVIGGLLHLPSSAYTAMVLSLLLGTPTMCLIAAIGMSLTIGLRRGSVLLALLVLPLYVPILIFGALAVNAAAIELQYTAQLALLAAALIATAALSPWAAGAALRVSISE